MRNPLSNPATDAGSLDAKDDSGLRSPVSAYIEHRYSRPCCCKKTIDQAFKTVFMTNAGVPVESRTFWYTPGRFGNTIAITEII